MLFPISTRKKSAHGFTGKNLFGSGLSLRVKAALSESRQKEEDSEEQVSRKNKFRSPGRQGWDPGTPPFCFFFFFPKSDEMTSLRRGHRESISRRKHRRAAARTRKTCQRGSMYLPSLSGRIGVFHVSIVNVERFCKQKVCGGSFCHLLARSGTQSLSIDSLSKNSSPPQPPRSTLVQPSISVDELRSPVTRSV